MSEHIVQAEKDVKEVDVKEKAAEKDDEGSPRGTKRSLPDSTEDLKVSSPNDWEHADLGDKERKSKFLRLMGATKKEHHGKFVIGDQERAVERSAEKTNEVTQDLENQYEQGIAHRLQGGRRGHTGLGFQESEKTEESNNDDRTVSSSEKTEDSTQDSPDGSENCKDSGKDTLPDSSTQQSATQKYAKLGFVKGSSAS